MHRALVLLALGIVACADGPTTPPSALGYVTTQDITVLNAPTGRLAAVPAGVRASIATAAPLPPLIIPFTAKGAGYHATAGRVNGVFVARDGTKHQMSALYQAGSGPPVLVQAYTKGKITSITRYTWTRTSAGYLRTKSTTQAVIAGKAVGAPYTIVGTATTTTAVCNPRISTTCGQQQMLQRHQIVERLYGLLTACTASANAQGLVNMSFVFCSSEWIYWALASLALSASTVAVFACPECMVTEAWFAGSLAAAAKALDALVSCMISDPAGGMSTYTGGSASPHAFVGDQGGGEIIAWVQ